MQRRVGCQYAVIPVAMDTRRWHQRGNPVDALQRAERQLRRSVRLRLRQVVAQMHVVDRLEAIEGKGPACAITQQDQSRQARRPCRLTVLVDAVEANRIVVRSFADAPEIDGQVLIPGAWEIEPGDFVEVTVTGSDDYDL